LQRKKKRKSSEIFIYELILTIIKRLKMSKTYLIFALIIAILFISGCLMPPEEEPMTEVEKETAAITVQDIEQAKTGTNTEEVRQKCAELLEIDLETLSQPQVVVQATEPVVQEQQVVEIVEEPVVETQVVEQTSVQIVYDENLSAN
jgi:PBP1b-binding outer membrane lipoprotein LpoB